MKRERRGSVAPDVEALRRRVEAWRATRVRRSPMPEELWATAFSLVEKHGLWPVARDASVDYGSLKARVERATEGRQKESAGSVGFVEVDACRLLGPTESESAEVELTGADGSKVTVRLEGRRGLDVVALAEAFWRRSA